MLEAVGLIPVLGKKNHVFVIILKKKAIGGKEKKRIKHLKCLSCGA